MESQKIINLLDDTTNQPSKFRPKNWVEMNDESWGTYNASNQIKFKTSMIRSDLCDYSDAYILVSGAVTITGVGDDNAKRIDKINTGVIFENCVPFTNCISTINNTQKDNVEYIDVVMPMYKLIEYSGFENNITEII